MRQARTGPCVSVRLRHLSMCTIKHRSSTDMSLSACICRSPATEYKWESFAEHAILIRDTTYYSDDSRVYERARIYVYVTILTDFFASSLVGGAFLSSLVHLSRVTPSRLAQILDVYSRRWIFTDTLDCFDGFLSAVFCHAWRWKIGDGFADSDQSGTFPRIWGSLTTSHDWRFRCLTEPSLLVYFHLCLSSVIR